MTRLQGLTARGLRLWTLATRFALIFFLARFLAPADVGLYGLFVATVGYVIYILGMDLYTFSTREILKADPAEWRTPVKSHAGLLGWVYVIVLPSLLLLFAGGLLPWGMLFWFYVIAISEHVALEMDRMLIAMSDQLSASIIVFIRQAMLPTVVIPLFMLYPESRSLTVVFIVWVGFNALAIIVGGLFLARKLRGTALGSIDWPWILRGLKVSLAFLIGSLCLRLLFAADRQIVANLSSFEVLGAYTFAMSVGTGLSSALAVSVHQFLYPKLVVSAQEKDLRAFRGGLLSMAIQTLALIAIAATATFLLKDLLVGWAGHPVYAEFDWLFLAAIGVYGLYNLSLIPHYALYALHGDRTILLSTVSSVLVFGAVVWILLWQGVSPVIGVTIGLSAASALLFIVKWIGYRSLAAHAFSSPKVEDATAS